MKVLLVLGKECGTYVTEPCVTQGRDTAATRGLQNNTDHRTSSEYIPSDLIARKTLAKTTHWFNEHLSHSPMLQASFSKSSEKLLILSSTSMLRKVLRTYTILTREEMKWPGDEGIWEQSVIGEMSSYE